MKVSEGFSMADSRNLPKVDYMMFLEYMRGNDTFNVAVLFVCLRLHTIEPWSIWVHKRNVYSDTLEQCFYTIGTIHEDVTTDVLGCMGTWQWLVTIVSTVLMVPSMFNQYKDIFLIEPGDALCVPQEGFANINSNSCYVISESNSSYYSLCNQWHEKLLGIIWLKRSWLVFCDHELKLLTMTIISRFGMIFGCIMYGFVADSVGRKFAIVIDLMMSFVLGLVVTFCDSEAWFRLIIFIKSVFGSATIFVGILIVCEISSNNWRGLMCTIVSVPRLIAMVCLVPLADTIPNQETYTFMCCLIGLVCLVSLRWCPESPHWLLFNRKIPKAENILKNAAKMNAITLCQDFKIRPVNYRAYNSLEETCSCVRVLTTHNVRTMVSMTLLFWMLYYFLWSSLFVNIHREENVSKLLLKVLCFVCILGCLTMLAAKKLTMKFLLLFHVIITGAGVATFFFTQGITRSIVASLALSSGVIANAILLNITPRLFAINIRATICGCCHATGQLGSIICLIMLLFRTLNDVTYVVVELCVTVVLAVMCLVWPNVDGRELPDVLEDMDYYSELSKPLRWASQKTNSPSTEEIEMRIHSFGSGNRPITSDTRIPPRRIGFVRLKRTFVDCIRQTLMRKNRDILSY